MDASTNLILFLHLYWPLDAIKSFAAHILGVEYISTDVFKADWLVISILDYGTGNFSTTDSCFMPTMCIVYYSKISQLSWMASQLLSTQLAKKSAHAAFSLFMKRYPVHVLRLSSTWRLAIADSSIDFGPEKRHSCALDRCSLFPSIIAGIAIIQIKAKFQLTSFERDILHCRVLT